MSVKAKPLSYYLRFPLAFGSVLAVFIIGFSYRRNIFAKDIEAVRQQNRQNEEKHRQATEELKRLAQQQFAMKEKASKS